MGDDGSVRTRQQGLQQAASVIFALVAIVPLLIFAWTLHALGVIRSTQAQVSLALALALALLGFWMFRSLLGRMAEVVQALAAAVEQANRARRPAAPAAVAQPVAAGVAADLGAAVDVDEEPAPAPRASSTVFRPATPPGPQPARAVAGIGDVRELTEVVRAMDALWYREASAHLGQHVRISVANSRDPLVGTLSEAATDGLILEQPDGPVAIAYGRVTAIDRSTE